MAEGIAETVGSRIRALREESGIGLRQFAAEHGFNPNVLSRIERGNHNMTMETLFRIARALDMTPADLLAGLD